MKSDEKHTFQDVKRELIRETHEFLATNRICEKEAPAFMQIDAHLKSFVMSAYKNPGV